MGKEKNVICTTEQLEEFLQQRNDIILDELKSILQQNSKNTDGKISTLKGEVENALKLREKELRRLRRETEESFRTCERLLHALTFQRKMLEAVLKIRDREIQNLRRCVGIQKRLIVKTLNVVVADGVLEMSPKQRGELLKLVQEMGDIDINSSEGVGFSEETVLNEYREALVNSDNNANTNTIDNVITVRRAEKAAKAEGQSSSAAFIQSMFTPKSSAARNEETESDEEYVPLDIKAKSAAPAPVTTAKPNPVKAREVSNIFGGLSDARRNEKCSKAVLFETGKLLGSAWVSFAITQRIGFSLDDTSVLRKRYNSDEERAKAMLLIWCEQSGEGTYANLVLALNDIGRKDIAQKVIQQVQ